ncbi:predicted protein [Lichtheimia corymbifera JMRC:FSU:9682]|uniref:Uncharacterized protein n=1 Tax=Lichtheimia corymbifera JMRC:FSU:9682 TaxID=1263082 RepID=A0A068RPX3_9FUNG|nr:predicted protein [Lichtheimia corymbifera JMRC:FSU:9682]
MTKQVIDQQLNEKETITGVLSINILRLEWLWMDGWMQSKTVIGDSEIRVGYLVPRQQQGLGMLRGCCRGLSWMRGLIS